MLVCHGFQLRRGHDGALTHPGTGVVVFTVIRSIHSAHNEMINIEKLSDRELEELTKRYEPFSAEWHLRYRRRHPVG